MRNILNWLTASSADPLKTSAMLKGSLKLVVAEVLRHASIACSLGIVCVTDSDAEFVNQIIEYGTLGVAGVLYIWGGIQGVYGAYRKWKLGRWAHPSA